MDLAPLATINVADDRTGMPEPEERRNIVIIGGGIIGCTTAYYLTRHPRFDPSLHTITLLEATNIACGASGKAGGLLASWAYPTNICGLSFDLHGQLAEEHNGVEQWGYRRVRCGQLTATASDKAPRPVYWNNSSILLGKWRRGDWSTPKPSVLPDDLDWFSAEAAKAYEEIADTSSTAQVHPLQFTKAMARLASEKGTNIVLGMVTDINCTITNENASTEGGDDTPAAPRPLSSFADPFQRVVSVTYTDKASGEMKTIPSDTIVLAAGPWTPTLLPGVPISSLRAHSVTIRPRRPVSAYCLFTEITLPDTSPPPNKPLDQTTPEAKKTKSAPKTRTLSPELYARPNNEVYICGRGDVDCPLPLTADLVEVSTAACAELVTAAAAISDELRDGMVSGRRACYLPTMDVGGSGGPLIGNTDVEGLVLAAGHSCWGILNAPATGKAVSELILDGEVRCADLGSLDPRKIL
ncbi:hypothetical protein FGG08_005490 [Glutinoglossum americanum]|uniref:FAD dependent oxidoreductase domain-containing protein n=1 Tax=Glutinoglossum americanum TaxID=1670608 RepID=A0A9P8HY20_9PEZI|nr:hypothetical protein FGG08_005490 [Glutinoglossum americanum]